MAKDTQAVTAALAVIKVNGVTIGKMKTVRITESIQRGRVKGIGKLSADEVPATDWTGTLSCDSYLINFKDSVIPGLINRNVQSVEEFQDYILLQEDGIQVDLLKKVKDTSVSPNPGRDGKIKKKYEVLVSIKRLFINREGMDISEGQIAGKNMEAEYLDPVIFPI